MSGMVTSDTTEDTAGCWPYSQCNEQHCVAKGELGSAMENAFIDI